MKLEVIVLDRGIFLRELRKIPSSRRKIPRTITDEFTQFSQKYQIQSQMNSHNDPKKDGAKLLLSLIPLF